MKEINKLIFSGGGTKGICYIGVVKCFEEVVLNKTVDFNINEVCGVSIGSVFGLCYILGYTYDELYTEIMNVDFNELKKLKLKNFLTKYGLDDGKNFMKWVEDLLLKKGFSVNITLKQLWLKTGINFKVVTSNVNKYCLHIFDYKSNPNLRVIKAIRMSISVPFMFSAEKYNDEYYVDGGLINNFPINIYDDCLDNVLGIKMITNGELNDNITKEINSFESFAVNVFGCFLAKRERYTTLSHNYLQHIIAIDGSDSDFINFHLGNDEKEHLINIGYKAGIDYFKNNV